MKRFVSSALLCAAVFSSIATSTEEDYPVPAAGTNDVAIGQFDTFTEVAVGGSVARVFEVAIPSADLDAVVSSRIAITANVTTTAGWSDVVGTVSGFAGTGSMELFADMSNTYTETVVIEDALDGCTDLNGWCTAEWSVRFDHIDGAQVVAVDYSVTATVVGPNTNVDVSAF